MCARAFAVCVCAILAAQLGAAAARPQDAFINVQVSDREGAEYEDDSESRQVAQLVRELTAAKSDALQLYTDYTGQAGRDMKAFAANVTSYAQDALATAENMPADGGPSECRSGFEARMRKIERDAYKAAGFSSENHHKFLLGHMVVFRMHLNKTEEYIKKCERAISGCNGPMCENRPKVKRWKRHALNEINRVKDDLQHSRRSYKDLVAHARRRLQHIRKQIYMSTSDAVEDYHKCVDGTYTYH